MGDHAAHAVGDDGRHVRYPRSRSNEDDVRFFLRPGMSVRVARPNGPAEMYSVTKLDEATVYLTAHR
jgi:hypothetical protein